MSIPIYNIEEWRARRIVIDIALEIMSDNKPRTARQICNEMSKKGLTIPKRLVNSVMHSEARRYVSYDRKSYTYQLSEVKGNNIDDALANIKAEVEQVSSCQETTREIRARYIGRNDEYVFLSSRISSSAFFETKAQGSTIEIRLNQKHPIFEKLENIFANIEDQNDVSNVQNCNSALEIFQVLLAAWAKYENEMPAGHLRNNAEDSRLEWGRNIREFILEFENKSID